VRKIGKEVQRGQIGVFWKRTILGGTGGEKRKKEWKKKIGARGKNGKRKRVKIQTSNRKAVKLLWRGREGKLGSLHLFQKGWNDFLFWTGKVGSKRVTSLGG